MTRTPPSLSVDEKRESSVLLAEKPRTQKPPLYKVVLLNDDCTPQDFVVFILEAIFHKAHKDAVHIMLEVQNRGSGTCGVFTRDVAETKVEQVIAVARQNNHMLQCVMERE